MKFIHHKIEERSSVRSLRRYKECDEIMKGLTAMGVVINDGMRTWTFDSNKNIHLNNLNMNLHGGAGDESSLTSSLALMDQDHPNRDNNKANGNNGFPCQYCGKHFASKNLIFRHLRDVTSSCGNIIFANGEKVPDAPSMINKKQRQEIAKNLKRKKTGKAAMHALPEASLWVGGLPLPYTRLGGQCKRLRALLREYLPRNVPQPWIKKVVRKGYREREGIHIVVKKDADSREDGVKPNIEIANGQRRYLGFAIIVFRDAQEANDVKEALHNVLIDPRKVFPDTPDYADLPEFTIKIKKVDKDSANVTSSGSKGSTGTGNTGTIGIGSETVAPLAHTVMSGNLDPPLEDQLRPLTIPELHARCEYLNRKIKESGTVFLPHDVIGEEDGLGEGEEDKDIKEPSPSRLVQQEHNAVLQYTVSLYKELGPREEVHRKGRPVPQDICNRILELLHNVRWPAASHRKGLTSERYLVLQTNVSNDRFFNDLREGCRELMQWTDPDYYYSGIAVTKNFVASPHIDDRDQSFQYAISLGDFTGGGQLCVEGTRAMVNTGTTHTGDGDGDDNDDDVDGHEEQKSEFVNVVETHNRIAKVDGRHIHWVRSWETGDRYSLIFYDTTERARTGIMDAGVDLSFIE